MPFKKRVWASRIVLESSGKIEQCHVNDIRITSWFTIGFAVHVVRDLHFIISNTMLYTKIERRNTHVICYTVHNIIYIHNCFSSSPTGTSPSPRSSRSQSAPAPSWRKSWALAVWLGYGGVKQAYFTRTLQALEDKLWSFYDESTERPQAGTS